jgi:hypothetical protein
VTENEGTRDEQSASDETAVLSRRDLDESSDAGATGAGTPDAGTVDTGTVDPGTVDTGAGGAGAGAGTLSGGTASDHRAAVWGGDGDEATVVTRRPVGAHQAWSTGDEQATSAGWAADGAEPTVALPPGGGPAGSRSGATAASAGAVPATGSVPATGFEPATGSVPATDPDTRGRRAVGRRPGRRLDPGDEVAVFPAHRPWTMVLAGVLALLWGIEAAFELAFNWSRVRGTDPTGRYGLAVVTVAHSSTSVADFFARVALNAHFVVTDRFDARLALGAFAVVWLIVGLLLLVAGGSGIRLGLFWCGLVALPAFGLARGGIDAYGWGLRHLVSAATTGAFVAPLVLAVIIALLTGTRRARLFSGRPTEPEYLEVNDPGEVWRGDR